MSSADNKEDKNDSVSWSYSGTEIEWDSFDRRMMRHMRKMFDSFGEKIWLGHIPKICELKADELEKHCVEVWNAISVNNPGVAKDLWPQNSGFWEEGWQENWYTRQLNLMCDYIEEHSKGQAEMVMVNYSGNKKDIRKFLYKQFGSGAGGDIHLKELEFDQGMPEKGKQAFPIGVNMPAKLRQLESRRLYFWKMCLPEKRATYPYCKETKLVRIVLDHIRSNDDYKNCIARLLDLVKIRKMIEDMKDAEVDLPYDIIDSHERSFNDDWLPKWSVLESALNLEYKDLCQKSGRISEGKLPVAVGAFSSNDRGTIRCYSCGEYGHKKGDENCQAGKYDVHPSAPPEFKSRQESKRRKYGGGSDNPKSPKKNRQGKNSKKRYCHAFKFGEGTCRYGAKCKFSHDTNKSGSGKGEDSTFSPSQQKIVSAMVASAIKKTTKAIAKKSRKKKSGSSAETNEDMDFASMMASCLLAPIRRTIPRNFNYSSNIVLKSKLHDVHNNVGIDSDAAISISTLKDDFLWVDKSHKLMKELPAPAGINGGTSKVGGIGPMLVMAKTGEYFIDPEAMFVLPCDGQPDFRVMSTQRLKINGVRLVGCWNNSNYDVLQDRKSKKIVYLSEEGPVGNSILVLETKPLPPINRSELSVLVQEVLKGNKSALIEKKYFEHETIEVNKNLKTFLLNLKNGSFNDVCAVKNPILVFNIAKLTPVERTRLYMRKFGMCSSNLLQRMQNDPDFGRLPSFTTLNEDNPLKDASKFAKKPHHRTDPKISMCFKPWEVTYVDGYGGGNSMGVPSFEGAIGGYLFVCPSVGELHHKLYSSHEQFPIAVFQFLLHVESEGNKCNKLYCDTFSVNISAELEEVCALFFCKIVPVSAGTPQEVSFVETQHRIIGGRSRAMLLNAPHLPGWAWALSDKYACYVGRYLPQSTRNWKSAAFLNSGKVPDWRYLCIYVFGAPCRYSPMNGPVHKRGEMTEEGYFVGVQHPMLIIIRKRDMALISVSKMKVIVYESFYTCPLSVSPKQFNPSLDGTWNPEDSSTDGNKSGRDNTSPQFKPSITNTSDITVENNAKIFDKHDSGHQAVKNPENSPNRNFGTASARKVHAVDLHPMQSPIGSGLNVDFNCSDTLHTNPVPSPASTGRNKFQKSFTTKNDNVSNPGRNEPHLNPETNKLSPSDSSQPTIYPPNVHSAQDLPVNSIKNDFKDANEKVNNVGSTTGASVHKNNPYRPQNSPNLPQKQLEHGNQETMKQTKTNSTRMVASDAFMDIFDHENIPKVKMSKNDTPDTNNFGATNFGSNSTETSISKEDLNKLNLDSTLTSSSSLPKYRKSIKDLYAHTVPVPNTTASRSFRPPTKLDDSAQLQVANQGEGLYKPEHLDYKVSDLQHELNELKSKVKNKVEDLGLREMILKSLDKAQDKMSGNVVQKGYLAKGKKQKAGVSIDNIIPNKRNRTVGKERSKKFKASREPKSTKKNRSLKKPSTNMKFNTGDHVSANSTIFDGDVPGSFSKDNPERQFGVVTQVWPTKNIVKVKWEDGDSFYHDSKELRYEKTKISSSMVVTLVLSTVFNLEEDPLDKSKWPKDFFHALVRDDWRDWVLAVKKEINSWLDFDAYTEIPYDERKPGSSIVPLGELYTRKRDLSFKFRQYLMGNLLKKGKDFDETFSCCISWDGIRWCAAVACVAGKLIYGLDAVTGFLQAKEQFNLYAYLPSHGKYSELSFEELAKIRLSLLNLIKDEGEEGLRKFASQHKKESRTNPKTCYRLNSSIYGAPSANHEWDMLFQNAHVNKCGLTLSEVEPSLYVKISVDENDKVCEWMIANVWTDDVRYFGTDKMLKEYEEELQKHIKVKFLGVPKEFVGTEFIQDLELGLCELKAPKYWESALLKVNKYFKNGVKERYNPMSVYDEKIMNETVSDDEFEQAKHLEYRELVGIISYQAGCTKLEMRYAVSICSRHRSKWGLKQFNVLLKLFEYGYTTRFTGIIYSKGLDSHGDNTCYCYADSGHSIPRSYGCTLTMMNGGVMQLSAKMHSITASSTCHDELIEFSIATNKVVGFRNIMSEMGLSQKAATKIYQDNEAAIQISLNRGALSKQSKHMDRKILTARNKIEDCETMPVYIETTRMLADIGTKALSDKQFSYLRDHLTGYALVRKHHPGYELPAYVGGGK